MRIGLGWSAALLLVFLLGVSGGQLSHLSAQGKYLWVFLVCMDNFIVASRPNWLHVRGGAWPGSKAAVGGKKGDEATDACRPDSSPIADIANVEPIITFDECKESLDGCLKLKGALWICSYDGNFSPNIPLCRR